MVVVAVFLEPRVFFRISRYRGGANQSNRRVGSGRRSKIKLSPDTKVYIIYLIRRYEYRRYFGRAFYRLVYFEYVLRPRPAAKHSSLKRFMLRIHGVG